MGDRNYRKLHQNYQYILKKSKKLCNVYFTMPYAPLRLPLQHSKSDDWNVPILTNITHECKPLPQSIFSRQCALLWKPAKEILTFYQKKYEPTGAKNIYASKQTLNSQDMASSLSVHGLQQYMQLKQNASIHGAELKTSPPCWYRWRMIHSSFYLKCIKLSKNYPNRPKCDKTD